MPYSQIVRNRVHRVVLVADELRSVYFERVMSLYDPRVRFSLKIESETADECRSRGDRFGNRSLAWFFFFLSSWSFAREKSQALTFHSDRKRASERRSRRRSLSRSRSVTVEK